MRLLAAVLLLSAPLYSQISCDYTVSPLSLSVPAPASTGQVMVTTSTGCGWSAASAVTWLHITSGSGYNSSGNATFSVDANTAAFARSGILTVAGKTITVTQSAADCSFAISPKSQSFPVGGASGSFAVSANCAWQAGSNNGNFITLASGSQGITDGTVSFTVAANGCVSGRTGSITVNTTLPSPPVFTVMQDGSQANLTISANAATAGPAASDGRFLVTTGAGCGWGATSDASWLHLITGAGSGNGAVTYHVDANPSDPRSGAIHVGSLTYVVTQSAAAAPAPTLTVVESAANYARDAVSPGEIVVLFGARMGPAALVSLQVNGDTVTNLLAGTQVLFDGVAAPMVYTRQDQVSAVAPYGLAGKNSTQVQVVYNGVPSNTVTMPVQASHPAVFTLDSSGIGPGAILNQDTSTNSGPNPAARGSVVAIYATGGGTTDPALADGKVTGTTLPRLTGQVAVTIGGIDAKVSYSGGAPGAVAGLTQINAEVPAGVAPGTTVPVTVRVGNNTSPANVTMAVR